MKQYVKALINLGINSLDLFYKELKILEFASNQNLIEYPSGESLDELAQYIIDFDYDETDNDELYANELFNFKSTSRILRVFENIDKLERILTTKKEVNLLKKFVKIYSKIIYRLPKEVSGIIIGYSSPRLTYYKKNTAIPFSSESILEVKKELEALKEWVLVERFLV